MGKIIAIDPHKWKVAGALFSDEVLVKLFFKESTECDLHLRITELLKPFPTDVDEIVVEKMRSYPDTSIPPNHLLEVTETGIAFAARFYTTITRVAAYHWKGQIPKKYHHPRILRKLTVDEEHLLDRFAVNHREHLMDAIGIGLWRLGR